MALVRNTHPALYGTRTCMDDQWSSKINMKIIKAYKKIEGVYIRLMNTFTEI